jgi:hypothetical protein
MNESIARSIGSPRWREKTMMIACKPDITLHEPVYRLQYPWVGVYMYNNLKGFEVYSKETFVCRWTKIFYGCKQLGTEPPMHNRSMVKNLL